MVNIAVRITVRPLRVFFCQNVTRDPISVRLYLFGSTLSNYPEILGLSQVSYGLPVVRRHCLYGL